jgi:hypothetical protein
MVIKNQLAAEGHNESLVGGDVVKSFSDGTHLFDEIGIPCCPNCSVCALQVDCCTAGGIGVTKRVNQASKKTPIDQGHFATWVG